ncbi:MAG: SMC family ATPase, partial [Bacteroidota bacterium]
VVQLKKWGENVAALNQRLENGENKIKSLQEEIQQLKQQSHSQESNIQQLRENQPLLDRLLPIRDWFDKQTTLALNLEKAKRERTDLQQQHIQLQRQQQQLLSGTSLDISQADLPINQLIDLLSQRQQSVEQDLTHQRHHFHRVQAQQELQRFANELVSGEPCPLCGSEHHPEPMSTDDLTDQRIQLEDQIQQLTSAQQKNAQALAKLEAIGGQQQQLSVQLEKRNQEVQDAQAQVDEHQQAFRWGEGYSEEKVQADIRGISLTSRQIEVLVKEKEALEKTLTDKEKTLNTYRDALAKLQQQQQQEAIQFEAGKKALRYVKFESHLNESDASIEELALEYESQYRSIETLYQQGEAQIRKLRSTLDALQGEIKSLGEREKELHKRLATQNQALDIRLIESPFDSLKEIEQVLGQVLDLEREKQQTREFHQHLHTTEVSIKTLQAKTEGKRFDEAGFSELKTLITNLEQQAAELMVEHGSLQREIERLQADLKHKQELANTRKQLQDRIDNLGVLRKMFHRSGFVNFVSTIYLENLCRAANERFQRLTRGSLSLETTASNSFQVRDFLNDGQLRSVKTLSGGQTFQASLSLALALADQVQQQAKNPQNFFFLDEGFGSQDKDSLQVIFQTLKSLRKENRIVGVISHVEELQQEIDAHLRISNDPQTGSQIEGSWE